MTLEPRPKGRGRGSPGETRTSRLTGRWYKGPGAGGSGDGAERWEQKRPGQCSGRSGSQRGGGGARSRRAAWRRMPSLRAPKPPSSRLLATPPSGVQTGSEGADLVTPALGSADRHSRPLGEAETSGIRGGGVAGGQGVHAPQASHRPPTRTRPQSSQLHPPPPPPPPQANDVIPKGGQMLASQLQNKTV